MKKLTAILTILVAISISCVAGYFSIAGLMALFEATAWAVCVMATTLEIGKVVAVQWLHMNWSNPNVNLIHKSYKLLAIAALMLITSIGIYGFLSKGHLEQKAPIAGIELKIGQYEQQIKMLQDANAASQTKLTQLDRSIDSFLTKDKAAQGLKARNSQKSERAQIDASIQSNNDKIAKLNDEILPLKMQSSEVEAKLGPVKYVAELFGWQDTNSAVRLIIGILMFAFDPFAIVMLISATISFREIEEERKAKLITSDINVTSSPHVPNSAETDEIVTSQSIDQSVEPVVIPPIALVADTTEPVLHIEHDDEHNEIDYAEDEYDDEFEDMDHDINNEQDNEYQVALRKFVHDAYTDKISDSVINEPTSAEKLQLIELLEKQPGLLDVVIEVISGYRQTAKTEIDEVIENTVESVPLNSTEEQTPVEKTDTTVTEPRGSWL